MLIGLILILVIVAAWVVSTYNFFVASRARIKAAVQEIGNQLKRQMELIPNLESSTKGYLKQEKTIFKLLTDARKQVASAIESGNVQEMADAGQKVASIVPSLKIAVEDNPEIKSDAVVTK